MEKIATDVLIIGAGPGGYVAAIRAGQLGMNVTLVDRREKLGGTCLNVGCIPSKVLLNITHKLHETRKDFADMGILVDNIRTNLKQMQTRKNAVIDDLTRGIGFLMKKNNVTVIQGEAQFKAANRVEVKTAKGPLDIHGRYIIIATGSEPASIPGIEIDEKRVLSSTGALNLTTVPKHLVVVGGGYANTITPLMDREVSKAFQKILEKQGMVFKLNRKLSSLTKHEKFVNLQAVNTENQSAAADILECDYALISTGRKPAIRNLGLENLDIQLDERGFIAVNEKYETSCRGIYAIGDVIPGPMLAHKAEEEGIAVIEHIAGQPAHVNYNVIPSVVYTSPEVASVGLTEEQLKANGIAYKVGKFPFAGNARAKAQGYSEGFVKILADKNNDKVLGVHILGDMAGTMISEAAIAMEFGASSEDIARTCHPHPTHSEALKEAGWATFHKALHA
jgi:dihydrolipoamide dehydrogenase